MVRKALGRGLEALLSTTEGTTAEAVVELPIGEIRPGGHQPRRKFSESSLQELADSIRGQGVLQPILVRPLPEGGYELVAGERRWRAARLAGVKAIPAVVKEADDRLTSILSLIENLQREDLNPIEQAEAFRKLMEEFGLSQEEVAARTGKDRTTVSNLLRLLNLPKAILEEVLSGALSAGHARALLALPSERAQLELCNRIKTKGLSVRETERLTREPGRRRKAPPKGKDVFLLEAEESLRRRFGTKVNIRGSVKRGRVEIEYFSGEELEGLLALLRG